MTKIDVYQMPDNKHICKLPWNNAGYGSTGFEDGTMARCRECNTWYFSAPYYGSLGPTSTWVKVRWYHFKKRAMATLIEGKSND